jgi:hypothetical protein
MPPEPLRNPRLDMLRPVTEHELSQLPQCFLVTAIVEI